MYDTTPRLMARQTDVIRLPQVAPNGCDDCSVESGEKHRYAECPGHQHRATPASELLADPASVALIRDLYAHARAVRAEHATYSFGNGRGQAMAPVEHTWTVGHDRVLIHDGWLIYLRRGAPLLKVQIDTARQVGQLLAAIGVLPERFITGGTR